MPIVNRPTLKTYFENGDVITASAMTDFIDSGANLADTTAQAFLSEISSPKFIAPEVSAGAVNITGVLRGSAAVFQGRIRQGVSAAASALSTLGDFVCVQEATVVNATGQVAFLPSTSNIVGFALKVLVGGSAAAGGLNVLIGDAADHRRFGKISVSATGLFEATNVSALVLTGVSGQVQMICSGASAGTNTIGIVRYYQRA